MNGAEETINGILSAIDRLEKKLAKIKNIAGTASDPWKALEEILEVIRVENQKTK